MRRSTVRLCAGGAAHQYFPLAAGSQALLASLQEEDGAATNKKTLAITPVPYPERMNDATGRTCRSRAALHDLMTGKQVATVQKDDGEWSLRPRPCLT